MKTSKLNGVTNELFLLNTDLVSNTTYQNAVGQQVQGDYQTSMIESMIEPIIEPIIFKC